MKNCRLLSIVALLLALAACGPRGRVEVGPLVLESPPLGFYPEAYQVDSSQVHSGETFTGLMVRLGMSPQDAFELAQCCDSTFDVRKLRAGNLVRAYYSSATGARTLRYAV